MYFYHFIYIFVFLLVPSGGPLETSESAHVSSPGSYLYVQSNNFTTVGNLQTRYSVKKNLYLNLEEDLDFSDAFFPSLSSNFLSYSFSLSLLLWESEIRRHQGNFSCLQIIFPSLL